MPNIDITDDITDVIPDGGTADVTDDSTPDQPIDSDVDDDAERDPDDYDQTDAEDMGTGGDPIPPDSTPPAEELPEPVPAARTLTQAEFISDYSAANLAAYEQSGAVPYAVYDDGTERQVAWADVSDPTPAPVVIESEAAEVAAATNQHFWQNSTDPATYGGAGVHVTDDEKDAWVEAVAAGFPDIATKPWHNILINSLGILLRTGLRNLVSITKSAIAFFDGNGNAAANITARFGADGYQVGQDNESHMVGDYHSLQLLDNFNYPYFHVSDLRNRNRIHEYTVNLAPTEFRNYDTLKSYAPIYAVDDFDTDCTVLLSGEPYTGTVTPIYDDPDEFFMSTFGWRPIVGVTLGEATSGHIIVDWSMTVSSQSSFEIAMTFGNRKSGTPVSGGSVVLGCNNDASGYYSLATGFNTHAIGAFSSASGLRSDAQGMGADASGFNTLASGAYSHSEGTMSEARGDYAHAEGYHAQATERYTHAEGNNSIASGRGAHAEGVQSVASEYASHAEGLETEASGESSHAQNLHTIAASDYQTAIGKANIADNNDEYALIIGNGTLDSYGCVQTRSNALAVTWDGIVETVGAKLSGLLEAARAVITKASGDTSTSALTVNDGTNDVLTVAWNGDVDMGETERMYSTSLDDATAVPSENQGITNRFDYDGSGNRVGYSQIFRTPTGVYRSFAVTNPKTGNSAALYINSNDDGTRTANLTGGVAWPVKNGGTGATSAADARTNLGLGSLATKDSVSVTRQLASATSSKQTLNAGAGKEISISCPTPSGYVLSGIVDCNTNHNLAGTIGGFRYSGSTAYVSVTNRSSSNWTDLTVTVYYACIKADVS